MMLSNSLEATFCTLWAVFIWVLKSNWFYITMPPSFSSNQALLKPNVCWHMLYYAEQNSTQPSSLWVRKCSPRWQRNTSEYMYMKDCAYSALCPEKDMKASRIITVRTQLKCCDSSVGRGLHQYCRGQGFKAHSGLNFLTATQLACVYNCDDHSCLSRSTVQILLS